MNSKDFFPKEFLEWEKDAPGVDFKPGYVDTVGGDRDAGILLSQVVYWHLPDKTGRTKLRVEWQGHLWIAKTKAEWFRETRLKPPHLDRSTDILLAKRLIHYQVRRFQGVNVGFIRLDVDVFVNRLMNDPILPFEESAQVTWTPKERRFINP